MGKSAIMAMFNSSVGLPEGNVTNHIDANDGIGIMMCFWKFLE